MTSLKKPTTESGDIVQTATRKTSVQRLQHSLIMPVKFTGGLFVFSLHLAFHDEKTFLAAIHWLKTIAGVIFIPKMITMLKLINLTIINL